MSIITDNTVLVHIYSGLESKNKIRPFLNSK